MFLVIVGVGVLLILLFVLAVYLVSKAKKGRATADETEQATRW